MGRQIFTSQDAKKAAARLAGNAPPGALADPAPPGAGVSGDGYLERVVKYIPSEIIVLYLAGMNVIIAENPHAKDVVTTMSLGLFTAMAVATPLYLWRVQDVERKVQLALSTGCFIVWATSLPGNPFITSSAISFFTLSGWTLIMGLVEPPT